LAAEFNDAMKALLFALLYMLLAVTGAAEFPPLTFPQGVGINIHFVRGHERDLDLIAAAGIKFIRMDFGWGSIERVKGQYNWADYEELTANLEKRGLRAIYILDYSNSLYEVTVVSKNPLNGQEHRDTASPQHPDSVTAFAKWAAAAAKHFSGRHIVWEIWNEPNISFWKPKPDVQQYNTLCLAAIKAIREADPKATVIAPATSEVPVKFLDEFFASGALTYLDAVSIHPYRSYKKGPETAVEDYTKLRALIQKHGEAPGKKNLPIISGEWGYSTFDKGISVDTQAAFIVRQQLCNVLTQIPISIWYDWKNDGENPREREENFGIVNYDLSPKPAYIALQTMTRALNGFQIEHRLPTQNEKDFVLLLKNKGKRKIAAWTTDEPHVIAIGAGHVRKISAIGGEGGPCIASIKRGQIEMTLRGLPQYITLNPDR
jgi:hypothetical protein